MDTILEIIFEVVLLVIFQVPGAFIRWVVFGCRRPFKEVLKDDGYINGTVGLVVVVGLVILITRYLL
ncbi:hypothetical protein [[Flexibacter] sp. ATCC 35208]|uniref:hypothetical protein n=1 Tax=[Flexibacter] sp. ATCC 35208 TaxID=1936242 RepID=UPI0009D14BAA|nr:hypothetical protein [[Flexibacter] sp. ATCC 35208]OMP79097.1 hypothetical protein BW716_10760 [[Flexibacter] sp. ATCC 35208]